jgi:hypothetical protein
MVRFGKPDGPVFTSPDDGPAISVFSHEDVEWHNSYSHATNDYNVFHRQGQSTISKGRLKFAESPQMKLDKDLFLTNMNMIEINGKKVLVQLSQAESTKDKEVVIGEGRQLRMNRPKNEHAF